ncbi:MAG: HPr family phosphocarrier protein [Spirochaetota bacterium]
MLEKQRRQEATFRSQVAHYATPVLRLCEHSLRTQPSRAFPSRDFLHRLNSGATRLQELLDHHGAQHSEFWFPFRESIAAAKLFSGVTYAVLHIRGSLGHYELISAESDCRARTDAAVDTLRDALVNAGRSVMEQAGTCSVEPEASAPYEPRLDPDFQFTLPSDRTVRHVENVGEVVVHLATSFLNLSEDHEVRDVLADHECPGCEDLVPDPISEESLRSVEAMFHNLQSMYDTYIFESDVEEQNNDLAHLRGHISIIYHLCEIATNLVHYYVRHMSSLRRESTSEFRFPLEPGALLELVFDYPIRFSRLYLESAVQLSQRMIQSYSVPATAEVPIPYYRGFHVRPSTLIARIVAHYGSRVTMELNGQEYDAGRPLELFRANEEINAAKRRFVADVLSDEPELDRPIPDDPEERARELQLVLMRLVREERIVVYDTDLDLDLDGSGDPPESTLAELAVRVIRHLLSMAKMDVQSDITVTFSGDNRAVSDIEVLANHGYGEDRMGNNIELPDALSYLRR